jgi:Flp pilus assembly secretin CpaC
MKQKVKKGVSNLTLPAANRKEDYDILANEIFRLREEKQAIQEHNAGRGAKRQRTAEMVVFLKEQTGELTEYDDKMVRQLVERVEVLEDKMTVTFKSEIEIEIRIYKVEKSMPHSQS